MASLEALLDAVAPGDSIFVAGSTGEPTALLDAWSKDPERTREVAITTSAVPGINSLDIASWHPTCHVTGLFMQPGYRSLHKDGRYHWLQMTYAGFAKHLRDSDQVPTTCILQVSPPGPDGLHSLGFAAEFMPTVLARTQRVLGVVNHAVPYIAGAPKFDPLGFDLVCEADAPLACYDTGSIDAASRTIAELISTQIRDGAVIQVGIGKVPAALSAALTGHRRLRIQSGLLGDGFRHLAEAGALDEDWTHQGCVMVGGQELYDWAVCATQFEIVGCERSHDVAQLGAIENFVAVNSALSVDLFGQCNLEIAGDRAVSGAGGAPDFARAARISPGGISIIALPATAKGGTISRVVTTLPSPALASLPRYDVDMIVTEHGVADLRGLDAAGRGMAIASIAAPEFRDELAREWRTLCSAM